MKLFLIDPIEKAKSAAKTKFRIFLLTTLNLFLLVMGLVEFHKATSGTTSLMDLSVLELLRASSIILFVAIYLPLLYLHNIKQLLRIIDKGSQDAG